MGPLPFLLQTAVVTRALFLLPLEGKRKYARLVEALQRDPRARTAFYRRFLLVWWITSFIVTLSLFYARAPRGSLMLRPIQAGPAAWAVLGLFLALLIWPVWRAREAGPYRDAVREQLARVPALLPGTRQERWLFVAVALSAGFCEELVFRGLIPEYFAMLVPALPWLGPAVSIAGFGIAHWYQGLRGVWISALLGAVFYFAMAVSGSVFAAMALHALNDLRFLALVLVLGRPLPDKREGSP